MSKFSVTITGQSAEELRSNIKEYLVGDAMGDLKGAGVGDDNRSRRGLGPLPETEDFLTDAAVANPLPFVSPAANNTAPHGIADSGDTTGTDSKGFPWDSRIHASSGAKTKDGSWRYRRGIEDHHVTAVEQELVAKAKGQQAAEMLPAPSIPASAPIIPFPAVSSPAHVAPVLPIPPMMPNAHTPQTFKQHIVPIFAKLAKDGKINQAYVQDLKKHFGVQEIHLVNEEQAVGLFDMFVNCGLIQKAQ